MSNLDDDDEGGAEVDESWMGTFSDMCLLLLVFFVLMVSMSTMEQVKFQSVFGSLRDAFGGLPVPNDVITGYSVPTHNEKEVQDMREFVRIREEMLEAQRMVYDAVKSYISTKVEEGNMSAVFNDGIITISVPDNVLFGPGSEDLAPGADETLGKLLTLFQSQRDQVINIKGYSDNSPISPGARYRDNWELSAMRAINVLRWLKDAGIPIVRLTATGMGDLDPLFPNDTPENQAKNRRVEFVLERRVSGGRSPQ